MAIKTMRAKITEAHSRNNPTATPQQSPPASIEIRKSTPEKEKKCSTADRAESKLRLFSLGFYGCDDAPVLFDLKKDFNDVINLGKAGKTEGMHNLLIATSDIVSDTHDAINHQAAWPRGYKITP